jgi:hypothetical protein
LVFSAKSAKFEEGYLKSVVKPSFPFLIPKEQAKICHRISGISDDKPQFLWGQDLFLEILG